MKQIVSNYSYSPTTNVVTLTGVNIDQDQLLLVVAPQVGRTMYNFASGVTGVVSAGANTRVTLNASTAGLTTTSPLVIFYDDHASTQAIAGTVTANLAAQDLYGSNSPTAGTFLRAANYYEDSVGGNGEFLRVNNDLDGGMPVRTIPGQVLDVSGTVTANARSDIYDGANDVYWNKSVVAWGNPFLGEPTLVEQSTPLPVSGTVTIGSLPAISGTVTANLPLGDSYVYLVNGDNDGVVGSSNPIPVTGSVSVGNISADGGQTFEGFLSVKVDPDYYQVGLDRITPEVTVTNLVNTGNFTTRFGTPVTANTVFATSAVTNGQRKYLLIQNVTTGSNVITVGIGFTPTTTQGIQLTAGAGITFESSYIPTGAVYVLSSVTASNFTILEA